MSNTPTFPVRLHGEKQFIEMIHEVYATLSTWYGAGLVVHVHAEPMGSAISFSKGRTQLMIQSNGAIQGSWNRSFRAYWPLNTQRLLEEFDKQVTAQEAGE